MTKIFLSTTLAYTSILAKTHCFIPIQLEVNELQVLTPSTEWAWVVVINVPFITISCNAWAVLENVEPRFVAAIPRPGRPLGMETPVGHDFNLPNWSTHGVTHHPPQWQEQREPLEPLSVLNHSGVFRTSKETDVWKAPKVVSWPALERNIEREQFSPLLGPCVSALC